VCAYTRPSSTLRRRRQYWIDVPVYIALDEELDDQQLNQFYINPLSFIRTIAAVSLKSPFSAVHISYRNCVFNYFCFIEILCAFDREFFSPLWLQLLVKFIKAGGGPVCEETSFSLTAQLQAIDLLRVLLPEWTGTVYQQK
jgi:hypothetical protein